MEIPINFFRSSSFNRWEYCEALYCAEYCMGLTGEANKKANLGTAVHKVMENLALLKKASDAEEKYITLEVGGKTKTSDYKLQKIIDDVFCYYRDLFANQNWGDEEYNFVDGWTHKALAYNNGQYDPRNLKIIAAEPKYDFELIRDWSMYEFTFNGEKHKGFLKLKGSVDLVFEVMPGTYNILDYKTGKQYNWNTDKEKTAASIQKDPQLHFYTYAVSQLYPEAKEIWATLFYINGEGAFTVCFDKQMIANTELMIKNRFLSIKNCEVPVFNRTWKCTKLCQMGKTTFENTHVKPIIEFRNGMIAKRGEYMKKCDQMNFEFERKGIAKTIDELKDPNFTLGHYQAPGGEK